MKREKNDFGLFPRFKAGTVTSLIDEEAPPEISWEFITLSLGRHLIGDWGDVDKKWWKENDYNLFTAKTGVVRSVYHFDHGWLYVVTRLEVPETLFDVVSTGPGKWE